MQRKFSYSMWWLLVICLMAVAASPAAAQRAQQRWSPPDILGNGWWQNITTDTEGNVHIAWFGGKTAPDGRGYDVLMYAKRDHAGEWAVNDVIAPMTRGYTMRNSLTVTSDGILHAVFRSYTGHRFANAPARASEAAYNWSTPIEINSGSYYVSMTHDRNDVLHLVYSGGTGVAYLDDETADPRSAELSPCALCNDMFYRRSTNGGRTWTTALPVSFETDSGSDRMDIFEGRSGRLYIAWDEGLDWYAGRGEAKDVRIMYSEDGGLTWSDHIILDGGGYLDRRPIQIALTEMPDGSLLVVWRYSTDNDRQIYYQTSNDLGLTWTAPQPISGMFARHMNDTPLDDYMLITDRTGVAHLFAVGQPDLTSRVNASLYHVEYRNGNWLRPQRIFYNPEMRPEWPKAALGVGNDIHLSFYTRGLRDGVTDFNEDTGMHVLYTNLLGTLPQEIIAFNPTNTPMPTPTIPQRLDPTTTPFPTVEPVTESFRVMTVDNYAAETVLGGLFAAGLLCAAILLLVRFMRR